MIANPLPQRAIWPKFPSVVIMTDIPSAQGHADYQAAKSGDAEAALRLVEDVTPEGGVRALHGLIRGRPVRLLPVQAVELSGSNAIPFALAEYLSRRIGVAVSPDDILQLNVVGHTGSSGWHRLASPALFGGNVQPGVNYVLVDDFVGQGGTLANLRGFILRNGG